MPVLVVVATSPSGSVTVTLVSFTASRGGRCRSSRRRRSRRRRGRGGRPGGTLEARGSSGVVDGLGDDGVLGRRELDGRRLGRIIRELGRVRSVAARGTGGLGRLRGGRVVRLDGDVSGHGRGGAGGRAGSGVAAEAAEATATETAKATATEAAEAATITEAAATKAATTEGAAAKSAATESAASGTTESGASIGRAADSRHSQGSRGVSGLSVGDSASSSSGIQEGDGGSALVLEAALGLGLGSSHDGPDSAGAAGNLSSPRGGDGRGPGGGPVTTALTLAIILSAAVGWLGRRSRRGRAGRGAGLGGSGGSGKTRGGQNGAGAVDVGSDSGRTCPQGPGGGPGGSLVREVLGDGDVHGGPGGRLVVAFLAREHRVGNGTECQR